MEVSFVTLCSVLNILCEMGFCGVIVWMALLLLKCFSLISFSVQSIINSITWLKFLISVLQTALKKTHQSQCIAQKVIVMRTVSLNTTKTKEKIDQQHYVGVE